MLVTIESRACESTNYIHLNGKNEFNYLEKKLMVRVDLLGLFLINCKTILCMKVYLLFFEKKLLCENIELYTSLVLLWLKMRCILHIFTAKKHFVVPFGTKNLNAYLSIDKQCKLMLTRNSQF